jgi:hypothetical protein
VLQKRDNMVSNNEIPSLDISSGIKDGGSPRILGILVRQEFEKVEETNWMLSKDLEDIA